MELYEYEKKHLKLLREHLAECTVLLKSNGEFPLSVPGKIAAYGSGVRHTVKGGTGSGEVNSRYFINVEQGLQEAGFEITSKAWLDSYDVVRENAKREFVQEIKDRARKNHTLALVEGIGAVMPEPNHDLQLNGEGDVAIYVLSRISGEGNDRKAVDGDVKLNATEIRDILELNRKYAKFMLILNVGGVVDLSDVAEVKNILYLSQLGVETGAVLADILLGKANPSGKLTTTWSAWEDYATIGNFGDKDDTRYREGIYVGYRYFDSVGKKALYPFGYGLSFTTFSVVTDSVSNHAEKITVNATVTNTGKFPGKEVVQVYVSLPDGKLDKPYQDLAAFKKTSQLVPGASEQVELTFDLSDLASYDTERSAYVMEKGNYIIRVGTSSADTEVAAVAVLDDEVVVTQARPCCGIPDFVDWKPERRENAENLMAVPTLEISSTQVQRCTVLYDAPQQVHDAVKSLTDEQLAYLNVGSFNPSLGAMSVIGNASQSVAGAAGESTGQLKDLGFPVMVMADGPAGLRLSREYFRDDKGIHAIGEGGLPESIMEFVPALLRLLMKLTSGSASKPKAGQKVISQYATAIPIGTALAQSWNTAFAEVCGDIVGDEMTRFGVHLWLAPAMNIHRSILCGRNFEYFSEDPLISGKMAAALTLGVQKHPGCGTTIKHYAANNQENNRNNNNSQVSERAMREIYLRGFGICVKKSHPCAVMTSYNLLNGVHTSERRDLIEDVLRSEYGFEGMVMTDWIVGGMSLGGKMAHRSAKARYIVSAGGDLIMPGGKGDCKDILEGLASGDVTREQLQINGTRVYQMAKKLTKQ